MSPIKFLAFSFLMAALMLTMISFVVFGQITVRKLRKKPEMKGLLGVEFANGWDILNVAKAISLPRGLTRRLEKNAPLFFANSEALYKNTTALDRALGRLCFYSLYLTAAIAVGFVVLDRFNV